MLTYPNINPVAFSLGPLHVHWYGLMYLLGFFVAWLLARWRVKHYHLDWSAEQISDLIFYAAMGVIVGGRVGYMLFYSHGQWLNHPWLILRLWEGGMSFHGGLLGAFAALWLFGRKTHRSFLSVIDFVAPIVPFGLGAGRIGNFINGELWGRVTNEPWGMVFPHAGDLPRHPSQLYEFGLEGILLFILVWWYASKPRRVGRVSAVFLMGYALCRLFVEFFRAPDPQLGYLAWHWLTMGQLLSLPMFGFGFILWWRAR